MEDGKGKGEGMQSGRRRSETVLNGLKYYRFSMFKRGRYMVQVGVTAGIDN